MKLCSAPPFMVNLPKRIGASFPWRRRLLVESDTDIRDLNRCPNSPNAGRQHVPLVWNILERHHLGPIMGIPANVSDGRPA